MDSERLAKRAGVVRTGGKGTVRRKKKAVHKTTSTDDKRLQSTLKRLGVNTIPGIEEVNLFQEDGTVVHFTSPKVQASIAANTFVISGTNQTRNLPDMMPGILQQMGADNLQSLRKLAEQLPAETRNAVAGQAGAADDDEEVPELVGDFDQSK